MSDHTLGALCERGKTAHANHLLGQLGQEGDMPNYSSLINGNPLRDARWVRMMYVKSGESSTALLPGQLVAWKTLLDGQQVVNPAATAGVQICGVVDHLLPAAGVAAGLCFLITVEGPTKFLLDANATSAEGDALINSATVAGAVRTGTTSGAVVGRNQGRATIDAGGGTLANATSFWGVFRPN